MKNEVRKHAIQQALAADGAIASFSSNLVPWWLNADRAPQLKRSVMHLSCRLMKHTVSSLIVMLCALPTCLTSNAQLPSQVQMVRYCDLVANPAGYDGKQIRLRAEYDSGWEHSVFADDQCVKTWDAKKLVWVEFDSALASNTKPPIMARFEKATWRPETDRDSRITDKSRSWRVELTVLGVFRKSEESSFGFGHTNAYPFMIMVSKIERVGTLKKL